MGRGLLNGWADAAAAADGGDKSNGAVEDEVDHDDNGDKSDHDDVHTKRRR